jgi:23S rRNA pseudouridine955/2504/2580 synthase/23S rRNA pseudouridine1911/1915/1917 synthase
MPLDRLNIVFEDDSIIVINKPSGILSIPDRYNTALPSLYSQLKKEYGTIFIVHRLDRDTSGLIIFAKDAESHRTLNIGFENNEIIRKYDVVVEGIVHQDYMEIDIPLRPSRKKVGLTVPSAKGKPSLTKVTVIEKYRNSTFLECELITGRHHQIRVHLQTIGYPLLIDDLYGNKMEFFVSSIKRKFNLKKGTEETPLISRLTMHAKYLQFHHPKTSQLIELQADYPKDFSSLIRVLKKYSSKF